MRVSVCSRATVLKSDWKGLNGAPVMWLCFDLRSERADSLETQREIACGVNMCIITELPSDYSNYVLSTWFQLRNLSLLDSAFCNRVLRPFFLRIAYGQLSGYTLNDSSLSGYCATWCIRKDVRISEIYLSEFLIRQHGQRHQILSRQGTSIRKVTVDFQRSTLDRRLACIDLAVLCPNVENVSVIALFSTEGSSENDHCLRTLVHGCKQINMLRINHVQFSTKCLKEAVPCCTKLTYLEISRSPIHIPPEIALSSLIHLLLQYCSVADDVLLAVGRKCRKLRQLHAFQPYGGRRSAVTDTGVSAVLQGCTLLRDTDVEHAEGISMALRVEMAKRHGITALVSSKWKGFTDELARELFKVAPDLTDLRWFGNDCHPTISSVALCAQHCPLIQVLVLSNFKTVAGTGFLPLFRPDNRLRRISLSGCPFLDDAVVLAIACSCPLLTEFTGTDLCLITDGALAELAMGCPRLSEVHLSGAGAGDTAVTALARHCTELRQLQMWWCPRLTLQGVRALVTHSKNLKRLELPPQFLDQGVQQMFGQRTRVYVVHS
jgi:hypothetical protein